MQKLVLVLSCLVCLTAAGRLGVERRLLWLENLRGVSSQAKQDQGQGIDQSPSIHKRQQFIMEVLLQVHKPLVNTQLIDMGKVLNTEAQMYTEPEDVNLLEYLEHAREHLLLGRNHIYNELNVQHTHQLIGLYKFLVLAADWTTFQRNVCFARLHMNPVIFVQALQMAVRDRCDTHDLIMPAVHEVLPQLFYDQDVINSAQNVDWGNLITKSSTIKPHLLDILGLRGLGVLAPGHVLHLGKSGLWHPWQEWRMNMIGAKTARKASTQGVNTAPNDAILLSEEEKIVVQVEQTHEMSYLLADPALHIFWNQVMNERLLQKVTGRRQAVEAQKLEHIDHAQNWHQTEHDVNVGKSADINNNWNGRQTEHADVDDVSNNWSNERHSQNTWMSWKPVPDDDSMHANSHTNKWQDQVKSNNWQNDDIGQDWWMSSKQKPKVDSMRSTIQTDKWQDQVTRSNNWQNDDDIGQDRWMSSKQKPKVGGIHTNSQTDMWQDLVKSNNWQNNDDIGQDRWMSSKQKPKVDNMRSTTQTDMWQNQKATKNWQNDKTNRAWWMSQNNQEIENDANENEDKHTTWHKQQNEHGDNNWQRVNVVDIDKLPVTHIDNARLLHVNRRRMQQTTQNSWNDHQSTQDTTQQRDTWWGNQGPRTWQNNADDTEDVSVQTGTWSVKNRGTDIGHGRQVQDTDRATSWNPWHKQLNTQRNWQHTSQNQHMQDNDNDDNVVHGGMIRTSRHKRQLPWHAQQQDQEQQQQQHANHASTTAMHDHYTVMEGDRSHADMATDQLRPVRSIDSLSTIDISPTDELMGVHSGEILMHTLQQLQARLNMEQVALNMEQVDDIAFGQQQPRLVTTNGKHYEQGTSAGVNTKRTVQTVVQQLKSIIDEELQQQQIQSGSEQVLKVIGDILVGSNGQKGNTWEELIMQLNHAIYGVDVGVDDKASMLTVSTGNLHAPICQQLLGELVQLIDEYKRELQPYTKHDLLVEGINVVDVQVDQLLTHMETVDADLINLVDQQLLQSHVNNLEKLQKKVVARQQRLNHQPFTISMEISAQQQQRVVVRTFLVPKVDQDGHTLNTEQQRQHFLLLDASVHTLQPGSNHIQRNSHEINWTTRDVSTLSEIYHRVMTGQDLQQLVGSSCRFPQHLLIPRGTVDGLPVQLIVLVTPVSEQDAVLQRLVNTERLCGMGIAGIGLDRLPLGFPLDRPIQHDQQLMLPNIKIHNTVIQHDDRVRVTRI